MGGRILIVDDVATNRIVYRARLAAAFYDPVLAMDGQGCLDAVLTAAPGTRPDLILLDLGLPDMAGDELLRRLRADPRGRDVPVIALAAANDPASRLAALSAGADDVIAKPVSDRLLLARVRNLMRTQGTFGGDAALADQGFAEGATPFDPPGTLAVLSSQPGVVPGLVSTLARHLRDRIIPLSRTQALVEAGEVGGAGAPDVFILQAERGGTEAALRLLSELKSHQTTRHALVCVLDSSDQPEAVAMAFDLGADDVAGPGVSVSELALRLRGLLRRKRAGDLRRARMEDSLRLALVDPLTGLYNRRYAATNLSAIAARAAETASDYVVMVVDLDRFKQVNDRHGHAAGDAVLVEVARRLQANLRDGDLLARIGGEEFLVVLPGSSREDARRVATRLCQAVDERPIRLSSGQRVGQTVSIGVAVSRGGVVCEALVEEADLALLEAKGAGRNQVTFRLSAA